MFSLGARMGKTCLNQEKMKPKHFDCHLVADCSTDHKPRLLKVNKWAIEPNKKIKLHFK